ncbi:MAG: cell division protease FtsH, partial [Patiriisocius sp.]
MAEENKKPTEGKKNKKPDLKKPKFSAYWIYGALLVFFLAIFLSGGSNLT